MDNEKFGIWGRTNLGEIFRFAWIEDSSGVVYDRKIMLLDNDGNNPEEYCLNYEEHIIKHSKKLIDLIEVGDFVNGYRVISVDYDVTNDTTECIELDLNSNYQYNFISIRQIQTILTKEQFDANCYKVGGEDDEKI